MKQVPMGAKAPKQQAAVLRLDVITQEGPTIAAASTASQTGQFFYG